METAYLSPLSYTLTIIDSGGFLINIRPHGPFPSTGHNQGHRNATGATVIEAYCRERLPYSLRACTVDVGST